MFLSIVNSEKAAAGLPFFEREPDLKIKCQAYPT
jgi:hypothetical protein